MEEGAGCTTGVAGLAGFCRTAVGQRSSADLRMTVDLADSSLLQLRKASTPCLSVALMNPDQALEAYISLATMTDRKMACSAAHMPGARKTLRA